MSGVSRVPIRVVLAKEDRRGFVLPFVHVSSRLPRLPKPPKGAEKRQPGDVDALEICDRSGRLR